MTEEQSTSPGIPVRCAFDEMVVLSELKPNPRNPNTHPPGQLKLLAKIIEHQGWWVVPVGEVGFKKFPHATASVSPSAPPTAFTPEPVRRRVALSP